MNISELKNLTEELVVSFYIAGEKSLELRNKGLKTSFKQDSSPVTNGDLEVDRLLKEKINKNTPNIPLISEETIAVEKKNYFILIVKDMHMQNLKKRK